MKIEETKTKEMKRDEFYCFRQKSGATGGKVVLIFDAKSIETRLVLASSVCDRIQRHKK